MRKAALLVTPDYEELVRSQKVRKTREKPEVKPVRKAANSKLHFNLKPLRALNEAQRRMIESFKSNMTVTVGVGSAGTGKTFIACSLALQELLDGNTGSIKIVRSAVPSRSVGFLKGSLEEKQEVYELPYNAIINEIAECGTAYESLKRSGSLEFLLTSYCRGLTFNDCVVIVDETQNLDRGELLTILTRCGNNCRMIFCGDTKQKDLRDNQSSYEYFITLMDKLPDYVDVTTFLTCDIVRSDFVKALLIAEESL